MNIFAKIVLLLSAVAFSGCSLFIEQSDAAAEKLGKGVKFYCENIVPVVDEDERQVFVDKINVAASPHSIQKANCVLPSDPEPE